MNEQNAPVSCTACGRTLPRADMFGVEPDLLCPRCADGVRQRMQVRVRPIQRDGRPVVTMLCLGISIALFIATDILYGARSGKPFPGWLAALYQDFPIWQGEVWRHLSCVFLHGGWWHILMNGFALWFLGRVVESAWGSWALAGLMVGTGVVASAVEWIASGGGVGLSGGLFGLCGFLWALRQVHPAAAAVMNERMIRWILTLLVVGVVLSATGRLAVGNWAHGAGLVSGYGIGMAVRHRQRRILVPLCGLAVVALVIASIYVALGTVGPKGSTMPRSEFRKIWIARYGK